MNRSTAVKRITTIVALAISVLIFSASLSGCVLINWAFEDDPTYGSHTKLGKALAGDITKALNNKDERALSKLFSENCRNYITDFDEDLDSFMSMADEEITSYKFFTAGEDKSSHYGKVSRKLGGDIELKSENKTIFVSVQWYSVSDFDRKDEGIAYLTAGYSEEWYERPAPVKMPCGWEEWQHDFMKPYGLCTEVNGKQPYKTKEDARIANYLSEILAAYENDDIGRLTALFSENARKEPTLATQAQAFFDFVPSAEYITEKPHLPPDEDHFVNCPSHWVYYYDRHIEKNAVREYFSAFCDMKSKEYDLCLLYCTRDDKDENDLGLQAILFIRRETEFGYFFDFEEEQFRAVGTGIYFGDDVKEKLNPMRPKPEL